MNNTINGILQPVQKHRFKLEFDNKTELTKQVMLFKPDYFNKIITVKFREDVLGIVRSDLKDIYLEGCQELKCSVFDSHHNILYTDIFQSVSMVGHSTEFDYNKSEGVDHSVILMFGSVKTIKP